MCKISVELLIEFVNLAWTLFLNSWIQRLIMSSQRSRIFALLRILSLMVIPRKCALDNLFLIVCHKIYLNLVGKRKPVIYFDISFDTE